MLEEAEDRAARAAVEGRQMRAGGGVISRLPKPYNDNVPVTRVAIRAGELFIGDIPASHLWPVAQQPAHKPLVIIESPYSGDVARNTEYARACLLDSLQRGEAPIASHLLHTQVLEDMRPDERELGIEAGLAWYRVAEKCVVYEDWGTSGGMITGIRRAKQFGVPVEYRRLETWRAAA
ncbi:DUF7768 domain-containing protein [Brucella anthropi]|uniref:DUF7768 domain-containing protein n=1 Tax=Brucella anthropi TaxID=529 RepID=A0A6L3Z8W0_BRUAN|nr:hypothetical protein [Brucella anthropi]KAB2772439.1 hypothetical protein F9L04_06875 [Brucella anthropi]UVV69933.1 hypothetical protein NW321_15270 [Brucella anthropi]